MFYFSPSFPALFSPEAKTRSKRTAGNWPVQSSQDWLKDLATIVKDHIQRKVTIGNAKSATADFSDSQSTNCWSYPPARTQDGPATLGSARSDSAVDNLGQDGLPPGPADLVPLDFPRLAT